MHKKIFKFISVSMINTFVGFGTILAMQKLLYLNPYAANLGGYSIGYALSYILNKQWTFNSKAKHLRSISLFLFASVNAYVINIAVLYMMLRLNFNTTISQLCAVAIHGIVHFLTMNFLVFRTQRQI